MSEALTMTPATEARRVTSPDLEMLAPWLTTRLQEIHPEATPAQIIGYLRGCVTSNEFLFIRTDRAAALATIARVPLEPQPVATEVFVFARSEEDQQEAADLYVRMASWAAHQNASRLIVDVNTDVTRAMIKGRCGHLLSKSTARIELGRLD